MTKAELEKLNRRMARFMVKLCHHSDTVWDGYRDTRVERFYRTSRKFIKQCGLKYEPSHKTAPEHQR